MNTERFQEIIDFGEIDPELLYKIVSVIEKNENHTIMNLDVKTSNCTSFVFVFEKNIVYQYFSFRFTCERILHLFENMFPLIKYDSYTFNLYDYINSAIGSIKDEQIITWRKIVPLNSLPKEQMKQFLSRNVYKLIWDIGKALYGLHKNGIAHRDARIDNIGIHGGNFVLFDFDGSLETNERSLYFKDPYDFFQSLKFHSGVDFTYYINNELMDIAIDLQKENYDDDENDIIRMLDSIEIKYEGLYQVEL
jgi:serine/threonine protein kinase